MYGYWMEPNAQKYTYSWGSGAPASQAADKTPDGLSGYQAPMTFWDSNICWRKRMNQHNFLRSKILKPKWHIIQPTFPGYFQQKILLKSTILNTWGCDKNLLRSNNDNKTNKQKTKPEWKNNGLCKQASWFTVIASFLVLFTDQC